MFLKCRRRKSRVIMLMMTTQLFQEKATDINIFCDTEFKASINHHRLMHLHKKRLIRNNIGTKNWMFTGRAGQWLEAFSEPLIFKLGFTSLYCLHTWTLTGQILHYQTGNIEYTRHIVFFFSFIFCTLLTGSLPEDCSTKAQSLLFCHFYEFSKTPNLFNRAKKISKLSLIVSAGSRHQRYFKANNI